MNRPYQVGMVFESSGIDQAEPVPKQSGFGCGRKHEGDNPLSKGGGEEARQPRTDAGAVHDHEADLEELCQGFDFSVQFRVFDIHPFMPANHQVGRLLDQRVFHC